MNLTKGGVDNYEGWYALAICILKPTSWTDAFRIVGGEQGNKKWTDEDFEMIIQRHEDGEKYKDIAKSLRVTEQALTHRLRRWKNK